jgi:hypothetical protein
MSVTIQIRVPLSTLPSCLKGEEAEICQSVRGKASTQGSLNSVSEPGVCQLFDLPSSCSTTMTSIAPLNVAGLIEFQLLETPLVMDRTYCIAR